MADIDQAPRNTHSPSRRRAILSLGVAAGALTVGPALSDAATAACRRAIDHLEDEMQKGYV